ncbi:hypothetical protein ACIBK8_25640 [Streptomyces sp. NPDC050161]|uniref:hypothetical protein n=1 Tax=Streptomyces sp. NPDC050161 TaxID=3365604 RepID=UPI0037A23183
MTDSTYPVRLAAEIARLISQLNEHLIQAAPAESTKIINRVIDAEEGILGEITTLMATSSYSARRHAEDGTLPREIPLALGRAANGLHDIALDLDEHADGLHRRARTPAAANAPAIKPAASGLVTRQRR